MKYYNIVLVLLSLSSCSMYNTLSPDEKIMYRLDTIDVNNHYQQPDSLLYSITSCEFKELVSKSTKDYQLIVIHTITCPGTRATMKEFVQYFNKISNAEIYLITPSDQIWKYKYLNYFDNIRVKRYMLNSELYSHSRLDVYAQGHNAKDKFIKELCSKCNSHDGAFVVLLFEKKLNLLFYTDNEYFKKIYQKDITPEQYYNLVGKNIYNDIIKIISQ